MLINPIQRLAAPFHLIVFPSRRTILPILLSALLFRLPERNPRCKIVIIVGDNARIRRRENALSSSTPTDLIGASRVGQLQKLPSFPAC